MTTKDPGSVLTEEQRERLIEEMAKLCFGFRADIYAYRALSEDMLTLVEPAIARAVRERVLREVREKFSSACLDGIWSSVMGPTPGDPSGPGEARHVSWPSDEELACSKGERPCSVGCPDFGGGR